MNTIKDRLTVDLKFYFGLERNLSSYFHHGVDSVAFNSDPIFPSSCGENKSALGFVRSISLLINNKRIISLVLMVFIIM